MNGLGLTHIGRCGEVDVAHEKVGHYVGRHCVTLRAQDLLVLVDIEAHVTGTVGCTVTENVA